MSIERSTSVSCFFDLRFIEEAFIPKLYYLSTIELSQGFYNRRYNQHYTVFETETEFSLSHFHFHDLQGAIIVVARKNSATEVKQSLEREMEKQKKKEESGCVRLSLV